MAVTEDAATVLEQFIHDVANLPAEIAHLYEEANAKQDLINECNQLIATRDGVLQKQVRLHGSLTPHPKEAAVVQSVREAYARAAALQEEKIALVTKAGSLMDRYVKRLDIKIRDLQSEGLFPVDNNMPTLLKPSAGNLVAVAQPAVTGNSAALQPSSGNAGRGFPAGAAGRAAAAAAAVGGNPSTSIQAAVANALGRNAATTASASGTSTPGHLEKRRRLIGPGNLPPGSIPAAGPTRHASLGPGTPKASTPGATSRAGSVGPGGTRPSLKKSATMPRRLTPGATSGLVNKKVRIASNLATGGSPAPGTPTGDGGTAVTVPTVKIKRPDGAGPPSKLKKKKKQRGLLSAPGSTSTRSSPAAKADGSTPEPDKKKKKALKSVENDEEDEEPKDPDAMDIDEKPKIKRQASSSEESSDSEDDDDDEEEDEGSEEDDEEEGEEDNQDDTRYCYCQDVSHGDMIACDNADCKLQWFHLTCLDMDEAPEGDWLCDRCRKLPKDKIRHAS